MEEALPAQDWDRFISSYEESSIFHTTVWREVLTGKDLEPLYLTALGSSGKIVAAYPFFTSKLARGLGSSLISLPHSDIGGAVIADGESPDAILSLFGNHLKRMRISKRLMMIRANGLKDPRTSTIPLGSAEIACTGGFFHLDLSKTPTDRIWNTIFSDQGGQRKKIRRLEKEGFSSSLATKEEEFISFCRLHNETIRNTGGAPHSLRFLASIWKTMHPKYFNVVLVRRGEEIVAGLGFFCHPEKNQVHIMYGAYNDSLPERWVARSIYLFAHWETLVWADRTKHSKVNFGTTPIDTSHSNYKFKEQFGGYFERKYQVKITPFRTLNHPLVRRVAKIFA